MRPSPDQRNWLSIEDAGDDDTTWLFDITFLLSDFGCIYGSGCPSIDTEPDPTGTLGCCTHGAHFVDAEDRQTVLASAALLTDEEWQFRDRATAKGGPLKKRKGDWVTRKVDGACIFLNRDDFANGGGCALHIGALNRGKRPLDWKPDVCWQVPIHLDVHQNDYGHETIFVQAWERRHWGPGGADFHWWCTENDEPYMSSSPLYLTARDELVEMVGQQVYDRLAEALDRRRVETPVVLG